MAGRPIKESDIFAMGPMFRGGVKSFADTPADIVIKELREIGGERICV